MSSSSGAEEASASPTEANAPCVAAMDAKLMVATGRGHAQQLKDLVMKEDDSNKMMLVVMAKQLQSEKQLAHDAHRGTMHPLVLRWASGSSYELEPIRSMEDTSGDGTGGGGRLPMRRASAESSSILEEGDIETTNESSILDLEGVTPEGDTALHVLATTTASACGQQSDDNDVLLERARLIYRKAKHLLYSVQNKNGDTPLHCAARAGEPSMVACLIDLAFAELGEDRARQLLLRKENKHRETALHVAVRAGNNAIVELLMAKDPELGSFPQDGDSDGGGVSPLYLAIVLQRDVIARTLLTSRGKLSVSGPSGRNVLHAAVLRREDLQELLNCHNKWKLRWWRQAIERDQDGSTPLHFAAAINIPSDASVNCRLLLEANEDALCQADNAGLFPIHVAASVGAFRNIDVFLKNHPGSAGLRDAKGRTFLHVAAAKMEVGVVRWACKNRSLSWIVNMRDHDGNTALHLAVEAGSLQMFCPLLGNPQVDLNLPNNKGETPLDVAGRYKLPDRALYYCQDREALIHGILKIVGAVEGVHRQDHWEDSKTLQVGNDESKNLEVIKDTTGTLCVGSVLIAPVTFGATFAAPGGYIADDHNNGGTPIFAPRYALHAFVPANALGFVSSTIATVALMRSGSPLFHTPRSRIRQLMLALYALEISITSLATAFALGAYVVLSPVARKTAVATCVLTSLVLIYQLLHFVGRRLRLLPPLCTRKGIICASVYSAGVIISNMLFQFWPLLFIFGWAAQASPAPKTEPPAPPLA